MAICRQACPYNTLDGCEVKEYGGVCQLTNTAQPITEYRMTNADRIRSMTDEELAMLLYEIGYDEGWDKPEYALKWLQQPAEESDNETVGERKDGDGNG